MPEKKEKDANVTKEENKAHKKPKKRNQKADNQQNINNNLSENAAKKQNGEKKKQKKSKHIRDFVTDDMNMVDFPADNQTAAESKKQKKKKGEKQENRQKNAGNNAKNGAQNGAENSSKNGGYPKNDNAKDATGNSSKKGGFPKNDNSKKVRVIPLGGLGEIGKNMTLFECGNDMVIIDCGVGFPDEEMFGIDLVIPDFSYIEANREKLRAVLLTHGHEDHIGAIPYFLRSFNVPVFGTALTIGIIKNKLKEHKLNFTPKLNTVKAGDHVKLGCFDAEFIHVNHSIPDACAIALQTPAGIMIHSGDFKLDVSPIEGTMMDLSRLGELGQKGVQLLMCESTNAERNGYTPSEKSVGGVLESVFVAHNDKRIVVATFSSNVHRVMQIIDISVKFGRKVAITGRSMEAAVQAATELGYMTPPPNTVIPLGEMKNYAPGQITLITTGSQGEPMSALYRMAFSDRSQVVLTQNDVVVLSSSIIPGNEKLIGRIINEFAHNGIKTIYDSVYSGVHASGHACSEEIKLLIQLCKPKFYMPVHGEYRHLNANRNIATYLGKDPGEIIMADIGTVVEVGKKSASICGTVPSGRTLIDGLGVGDVGSAVLRDRKHLSEDGMVIIFATVDTNAKLIINPPEIISKGFVYLPDAEDLITEAKYAAADELSAAINSGRRRLDLENIKDRVGRAVLKVLIDKTGRKPMVIPFITDL